MRAINLLPPEAFAELRARRTRIRLLLFGVLYLAVLAAITIVVETRVTDAEQAVTAQQVTNVELQDNITRLSDSEGLVAEFDSGKQLLEEALATDVSWSTLMVDLSRQIPDRLWLDGFTGSTETGDGLGTITVSGIAFDYQDVSAWLRSLDSDRFPGVTGTWVESISDASFNDFNVVAFSSTTSLTNAAQSDRLRERTPELVR